MTRPRLTCLVLAALAAAWLGSPIRAQDAGVASSDVPAFLDRLEAAWQTRSAEA